MLGRSSSVQWNILIHPESSGNRPKSHHVFWGKIRTFRVHYRFPPCQKRKTKTDLGKLSNIWVIAMYGAVIERFRIAFMANCKCDIHVYVVLKKLVNRWACKIILAFDTNTKLLNFTEKLKTTCGKYRVIIVTWSFLPFALCRKCNSKSL